MSVHLSANSYLVDGQWPRKNPYALLPTTAPIIEFALEYTHAGAYRWTGYELVRILEPLAGRGDFIDAVVKDFNRLNTPVEVVCAELDVIINEILLNKGYIKM